MADPCDIYRIALDSINERMEFLEGRLLSLPSNVRPDPIQKQLRDLSRQRQATHHQLQDCLASKNLRIIGVEATQAIQFFGGLLQGSHFAPSNSIPLVRGKPTLLRLYASTFPVNLAAAKATAVAGEITLVSAGVTQILQPFNGPLSPFGSIDRGSIEDTLNFLVPADLTKGHVQMSVRVFDPNNPVLHDELHGGVLDFERVPVLPIHGVLIHYVGPNFFDIPIDEETTGLQLLEDLAFTSKIFPVPGLAYTGCEVLEWSKKTAVLEYFHDLKDEVASLRDMSGTDDVYVGIIPTNAQCGGSCGLGSDGSVIYFAGDLTTAAHEIGHALGRHHTQCANHSDGADDEYPQYPNYPQGSIGEFGVDVLEALNGAASNDCVKDPAAFCDVMSYCERWIGPYTYSGLFEAIRAKYGTKQMRRIASVWSLPQSEFLHAVVRIHRPSRSSGRVEVLRAFSVRREPPQSSPLPAPFFAEALASDASVIGQYPCSHAALPDPCDCKCGGAINPPLPFVDVAVCIPWMDAIARVQFVDGEGTKVGVLRVAPKAPVLSVTGVRRVKNKVYIQWAASAARDARPQLRFGVRYSADGLRWRAVRAGIVEKRIVVDLDQLPGGESCRFQVLAYAGLRTSVAETPPFRLPQRPRSAFVVSPPPGRKIAAGEAIVCVGGGFSPCFGATLPEEGEWANDQIGIFGRGQTCIARGLSIGRHTVRLTVPDGTGGTAEASVTIEITPTNTGHTR